MRSAAEVDISVEEDPERKETYMVVMRLNGEVVGIPAKGLHPLMAESFCKTAMKTFEYSKVIMARLFDEARQKVLEEERCQEGSSSLKA